MSAELSKHPSIRPIGAALMLLPAMLLIGSSLIDSSQRTGASQSQESQSAKQPSPIQNPPAVAKQLESVGVAPPVELLRPAARLSAANQLEEYTCIVKNNTSKAAVAFSLAWTVVIEVGGKESLVSELQVNDSFIHPDVWEDYKSGAIAPGAESLAEGGPTYFEGNASVKRVGVSIDYVEFEDGSNLGPNLDGASSHQIFQVREGASKYKEWLVHLYAKTERSLDLVLPQLQSESIPDDLNLSNPEMKQGAYAYRTRMFKLYNAKGPAAIQRILQ